MTRDILLLVWMLPLPAAYLLDNLLGDPEWMPHPVRLMGKSIEVWEKGLRRVLPASKWGQRVGGIVLAAGLPLFFLAASGALLAICWRVHPGLWAALETLVGYQLLAARSLATESGRVHDRLAAGDLPGARKAVGRIVGRDTGALDEAGVARAAVETVAENTSDGVVAPLLYLSLGGAVLGMWYKAVNTLDSMVGYKNDRYLFFGRASAKLDDAANYLPARISALLMIGAAEVLGYDKAGAKRVWKRDRRNHTSPNSAHTEAVCAGALGVRLGGDAVYFGVRHQKPTIGDDSRPIAAEDILRANRLMAGTGLGALAVGCFLRLLVAMLITG